MRELIAWLFHGGSGIGRREIMRWWEDRRFEYNLWVGVVGFASWWLVLLAGGAAVGPGEDFEQPAMVVLGPVLYALMANLGYTFGWLLDVTAYRGSPRKGFSKVGLIFCVILTALPGIWAITGLLITIYTGRKLE
jgi:hypothetical protein